jgi:choline kinase
MGPRGKTIPKGFIEVGGTTLIARSLALLAMHGIRDVVVVTGHLAEHYATLQPPGGVSLSLVHNPLYAEKGSFESLRRGLDVIEAPFLLLESDVIYEARALSAILSSAQDDVILTSGPTGAGDEVYVWADGHGGSLRFRGMSKARATHPDAPFGELVGILKISRELAQRLRRDPDDWARWGEYESAIVGSSGDVPVSCIRVDDLLWGEIDNEAMLANVEQRLWPAILKAG